MSAKDVVIGATENLFNLKDVSVIDAIFGPVYVQHSALGPDGVAGLKGLVSQLPATSSYELVRTIADGELVVTEGIFSGFAAIPLIGYDVWRVVDGRIVEHWDALGPGAAGPVPSPVAVPEAESLLVEDHAEKNRDLISAWAARVLVGGDESAAKEYLTSATDVEYDKSVKYQEIRAIIAEGDVVYTRARGELNGPVIVNDVWRIASGQIVEHWGLVVPVPAKLPHDNGSF